MKEHAIQVLSDAREREKWSAEGSWIEEGFSELKSLIEADIEPKTTIYAISFGEDNILGNYIDGQEGLENPKYIYDELDDALLIFNNIVNEIWIGLDDEDSPLATIEDFLDIKAEDLEGFNDFTPLQRKMIERLFASSISSPSH